MRQKRLLKLLIAVVLCLSLNSTQAQAGSTWNFNFTENLSGGLQVEAPVSYLAGVRDSQINNPQTGLNTPSYFLCQSFTDPNCSTSDRWESYSILPPCSITKNSDCIQNLATSSDGLNFNDAIFDSLAAPKVFDSNSEREFSEGSSISSWKATDSNGRKINLGVRIMETVSGSKGSIGTPLDLAANVSQFHTDGTPFIGGAYKVIQGTTPSGTPQINGSGGNPDCIFYMNNSCAKSDPFTIKYLKLELLVTKKFSGWMRGRISDSLITIESKDDARNTLTVIGSPIDIPLVNKTVERSQLPPSMANMGAGIDGIIPSGASGIAFQTSQPWTMTMFKQIIGLLGDTATSVTSSWSFRTLGQSSVWSPWNQNLCLSKSTGFLGMVSTNSTTYDTNPPTFDGSSLNYSVASLHFTPDGKEFKGTYNLSLRSDIGRCLYGFSSAPLKAEISVTSENGSAQVATTTFDEKDGWLRFSANGFTFSSPSIKLKLSQEQPKVEPSPVTQKLDQSVIQPVKKVTPKVLCTKLKSTVLSKDGKTCPKGYRIKK